MQIKTTVNSISCQSEWLLLRTQILTNATKDVVKNTYSLPVGIQICTATLEVQGEKRKKD